MDVKLSDQMLREIKKESINIVVHNLMTSLNGKQIRNEIINKAVKEITKAMKDEILKGMDVDDILKSSLDKIHQRLQSNITKKLESGITVTFNGI